MITAAELYEKTEKALKDNDITVFQELFMTLPNKKKSMTDKEYKLHVKDLFIFITHCQKDNQKFYQDLLQIPLFEKIHKDIIKDFSKFNQQIEKKFTSAVTAEYAITVRNLAELIKNPDFLSIFKDKTKSDKWLNSLDGLPNKEMIKHILIDLSQSTTAFKLEKTGEFAGFLLGEATFAYQRYESSESLKKQFKTRQAYLLSVMEETTMVVQFSYKNPTQRHACHFEGLKVATSKEFHSSHAHAVKERSVIDALSVSPTRKTIIPFISVSSRTMDNSLITQSEQASRFITHLQEPHVKKEIIAKALKISPQDLSEEEFSQWKVEPQIMDIAPIDEWGKTRKGSKNSQILLGVASQANLGLSSETFDFNKVNYRRELNHVTYLANLFSGIINDGAPKRRQCGQSIDLIQANYWSIGVDTQEIYQIGECIKEAGTNKKKFKLLHLYCAQKMTLLLNGLEQAPNFSEVLPEGSLNKINQVLTVYHALCGSHGASCSNPINKTDFTEFTSEENVKGLFQMGNRLIKWIEKYPGGINTNLELFKELKSLKQLVGQNETEFKAHMREFKPNDYELVKPLHTSIRKSQRG